MRLTGGWVRLGERLGMRLTGETGNEANRRLGERLGMRLTGGWVIDWE